MKRILALILVLALSLAVLAVMMCGCDQANSTTVTVKIIAADNNVLVDQTVTVKGDKPVARMAIVEACKQKKLAYNYKDGFFSSFAEFGTTDTHAWMFYLNEQQASVGANDAEIKQGDIVSFKYEKYA